MFKELEIVGKRALGNLKKFMLILITASILLAVIIVFSSFFLVLSDSNLTLILSLLALLSVIPVIGILLVFLAMKKLFVIYVGIIIQRSSESLQIVERPEEITPETKLPRQALATSSSAPPQYQKKPQHSRTAVNSEIKVTTSESSVVEKKCPYCGRTLPYGDVHVACPYCGRRLK
ncbi:MAG: hypothetical protein QW291_04810 [Thermofilaceae archaeon]